MNPDLLALVRERLVADGVAKKNWAAIVIAGCDGGETLEQLLSTGSIPVVEGGAVETASRSAAYITSVTVQGFRGIGPAQKIEFTPGPGLTVVIGRNGSGKSSFAEALEVLFTGDSRRWAGRSKIWKEGWRNLHQPHPASIEAELLLEGQGPAKIACAWGDEAGLEERTSFVHPRGKSKTTVQALGWQSALVSYRPFLSYNELGSMLDEGPSKLYDALSLVLGLEDLVNAQTALSKARLERQKALDAADATREELVEHLNTYIQDDADDRATACRDALTSKTWGLDVIAKVVKASAAPEAGSEIAILNRALSLHAGYPDKVAACIALGVFPNRDDCEIALPPI